MAWSPILDALDADSFDDARRLYHELVAEEPRWETYARSLARHPDAGAPIRSLLER